MMGAGAYRTRFEWSIAPLGTPDSFGAKEREPSVQGFLWGALENVSAGEAEILSRTVQVTRGTIRLRNYPAIAARQLLRDLGNDTTWTVETVVSGDNETVCEVFFQ